MKLRIKKVGVVVGGALPAPPNSYEYGTEQPRGLSVPIEYTVEGHVDALPTAGESVRMARTKRNDVEIGGYFVTSPIQSVDLEGQTFKTLNSQYYWEVLEE